MYMLPILDHMDGYVTISEVAQKYRVSGEHVRTMCADGRLIAERVGGVWRIPQESLQAFKVRAPGAVAAGRGGDANRLGLCG